MTLIRKLALAVCWALLLTAYSASTNAQTVDYTTGDLINSGTSPTDTTSTWNNGVYVNTLCFQAGQAGNCGPNPSVRAASGSINFSYGQTDLNQVVNINRALAAGGSGVQLSGFNFGFMAKNGNGWDNGQQDYLDAYVKFYNAGGGLAATYDYASQTNRKYNWTNFQFSETFSSPVAATNFSNARVGFIGRDTNYWAGNYGPEIYNVSFSLKYSVDPCKLNAAYSPTCAGFNNIVESNNLFNSNAWGQSMVQAVAINQALQNAGIGAQVHGLKYSFDWAVGSSQCTDTFLFWCTGWSDSNINVNVRMTSASGQALLNRNYGYSGQYVGGHVEDKYLLPSTMNQTALGSVGMASSGCGDAQAGNFKASLIYTPDPCVGNPLYSSTCSGYAVAFAKNMLLGSTVASASGPIVSSTGSVNTTSTGATIVSGSVDPTSTATQPAQQQAQSAPQQQAPAPAQQDPNQNPSVAQDNPAQPSPTQAGPAPTQPQPAGGPPQTATASAPPPSAGPSQPGPSGGGAGPSKLAMSVVKSAQAKEQATQQMAVQQAAKAFEGSQASSQAASNLAITMNQDMSANSATAAATFASQSTQTSIQASQQIVQSQSSVQQVSTQTQQSTRVVQQVQQQQEVQQVQQQSNGSVVQIQQAAYTPPVQQQETQSTTAAMLKPPTPAAVEVAPQASSGTGLTISRNPFAYNPLGSINLSSMSLAPAQTAPVYQPRLQERVMEIDAPQVQVASFGGVGKAGNPLSEMMMQQRFELMQENIQSQTSTVNRNVQPNDLAGGVDLASMALQPKGFETYSFMLRDAAFYEPKEVYKGQRVVDNVRVLRQMSSDSLHKQMVDSQYKQGE
jgi:hypothetical protein